MPLPQPSNAQFDECLRRISEAEQCLEQIVTAKSALQAARQALNGSVAAPNGNLSKGIGQKPAGPLSDAATGLVEQAHFDRKKTLNSSQNSVADVLEEGLAADAGKQLGIPKNEIMNCFGLFCTLDKDASGKIDVNEMKGHLGTLIGSSVDESQWQQDLENLLLQFDKNDDNQIDFEEFLFIYSNMPERRTQHLAARVNYKDDHLSSEFRVNVVGVRADDVIHFCKKELREERAFLAIPLIIALFLTFVVSVSLHRQTTALSSIEEAFRFDVEENANFAFSGPIPFENGRMGHKTMYDVNSFADFWSWLDLGIIPLYFPESWDVSEARANAGARCTSPYDAMSGSGWEFGTSLMSDSISFNSDIKPLCSGGLADPIPPEEFFEKPPYMFFNSIVGGVRLRQELEDEEPCMDSELLNHAYATTCVKLRDNWLMPDHDTALQINHDSVNRAGGETQFFLSQTPQSEVRLHLRRLENSAWLNQRTSKLEVLFTTYNAHNNIFVAVYINFFLNSAGHIHKVIKPMGTWMNPYSSASSVVADIIWCLLVLKLLGEEIRMLLGRISKFGFMPGLKFHFSQFVVIVNWASIVFSFALLALWIVYISLVSELRDYLMTAHVDIQGSWVDSQDRNDFYELVDRVTHTTQILQACLAFYPFAIGCRFFSAFAGQPRLAVVTDTLKSAWNDVLHFGIVLVAILLCYAVSAVILFGREVAEYETLGRCMVSVIRILLGDFDYESLSEIGRPYAMLWFTSFMVLLNLVMLNMLLAIIMDVYSSVKGSLDDNAETIFSQTYEIYRRWRQKRLGQRVGLDTILQALEAKGSSLVIEKTGEPKLITVTVFMNLVNGLSAKQAQRVLTNSEGAFASEHAESLSEKALLRGVDLRVQHLQQSITAISEIDSKLSHWLHRLFQDGIDSQNRQMVDKEAQTRLQKDLEGMQAKFDRLAEQLSDTCSRMEAKAERVENKAAQLGTLVPMMTEMKANSSAAGASRNGRLPLSPAFCTVSRE